jgi:integrase
MGSMPRPRPPHLHRETTRHGRTVWFVRIGHGPRVRLRATYGSPEFQTEYQAAVAGKLTTRPQAAAMGTLSWLVERYRETSAWKDLSHATRRQRENIMVGVLKTAGTTPCSQITRAHIVSGRDRRAETPAQARNFLDCVRGLFRWALDAGHVKIDPTQGVTNPARPKGGGFQVWSEDDVARYEARWPIGTKERVWLAVLLYSGLRRGDAVKLGRQHVRDGVATIRTEKTGVTVTLPILPALEEVLQAGPVGEMTFIAGTRGLPFRKESFGTAFAKACKAAGLSGRSAHGVRKAGATRAAENGATVAELNSLFGWSGEAMSSLYTKSADRARLAKGAISKLVRTPSEQSIPAPPHKVRESKRKNK